MSYSEEIYGPVFIQDYSKFKHEFLIGKSLLDFDVPSALGKTPVSYMYWEILTICLRAILSVCDCICLSDAICDFSWVCVRNVKKGYVAWSIMVGSKQYKDN